MKVLAVALSFAAAVSSAQADSYNCGRIGCCSTQGKVWDAAVSGNYVYVADDISGLRTIDVVNLQSPAEEGRLDTHNPTRAAPGGSDYALEAGGALVGGALVGAGAGVALGIAGAYLAASSSDDEWASLNGFVFGAAGGIALGYPCGCAMGTATVGRWMKCDGSTGRAYAGAYIGMLAATIPLAAEIGAIVLTEGRSGGAAAVAVGVAALLPPAGAVIGYNLGGPRTDPKSPLGARIAPPTLAYRNRLGPDRQKYSAFDCRLVTVRF